MAQSSQNISKRLYGGTVFIVYIENRDRQFVKCMNICRVYWSIRVIRTGMIRVCMTYICSQSYQVLVLHYAVLVCILRYLYDRSMHRHKKYLYEVKYLYCTPNVPKFDAQYACEYNVQCTLTVICSSCMTNEEGFRRSITHENVSR